MMKMAKIQLGHQLYIYQLIAKEYGTGHQIFLPKIEELFKAEGIEPEDLGFETYRDVMAACSDFVTLFPKIRHGRYPVGVVDAIHALWSIVVPYEVRNGWGGSLFPHGVGFVAKTMVVLAGRKPLAVLFKTEFIGRTLSSITVFRFDGGFCEELAC